MTQSELKVRGWLKALYPRGYIKKIPDFKCTGSSLLRGLPDYFVIDAGITRWFEAKYIHGTTFNFNDIRESQYIEFKQFLVAGYDVTILVVCEKSKHYIVNQILFSEVLRLKESQKSIKF